MRVCLEKKEKRDEKIREFSLNVWHIRIHPSLNIFILRRREWKKIVNNVIKFTCLMIHLTQCDFPFNPIFCLLHYRAFVTQQLTFQLQFDFFCFLLFFSLFEIKIPLNKSWMTKEVYFAHRSVCTKVYLP